MQSPPDPDLLKKLTQELVPDLTKALKLVKTRVLLLVKISKQPEEDYRSTIKELSMQEYEFVKKYQQIDRTVLLGFQMEFQRLFCRIIETVQQEKKNAQLQEFVVQTESIIYQAINDERVDYIRALASIYGKGRTATRGMVSDGAQPPVRVEKLKELSLSVVKNQKKIMESKEKLQVKSYSYTVKVLTGLDLDYTYGKDSHLNLVSHQDEALLNMIERNKPIAGDISSYKRQYTENTQRRQKKSAARARKLVPANNLQTSSSTRIPSAIVLNEEQLQTRYDENLISEKNINMLMTSSFHNCPPYPFSKQNRKNPDKDQRKTSQSFRLVQTNIPSRQVTPKKILFTFNKASSKFQDSTKPLQFNVRRKNKQYSQIKVKMDSTFDILIEGKKIEEDLFEFTQTKRRSVVKKNLSVLA